MLKYFRLVQVDENILTRIFRAIATLCSCIWSAIASERKYCYTKISNVKYLGTKIRQITVVSILSSATVRLYSKGVFSQ